ncbi:unnamed protein product [Ectocarpus sp. 12 AP-2014]
MPHDESSRLLGGKVDRDRKGAVRWKGLAAPVIALLLAIGVFVAATAPGRLVSVKKEENRPELVAVSDSQTTTWECGTSTEPVLNGADVVSYFSLKEGEAAMYGFEGYQVKYNGYTFMFASAQNKALFEASPLDYIPAWGGFCAFGIAAEDWWTESTLGPPSDPNSWLITDDNVLRIFRSELPKAYFMEDIPGNIAAGDRIWTGWWGEGTLPGADGTGSAMNTACMCNIEICLDQ